MDESGQLIGAAGALLKATCYYPEDEISRRDYVEYIETTNERLLKERDSYEASAFLNSVEMVLAKGIGQRAAAGLVFIYLYRLVLSGESRPKLRQATRQVEKLIEVRKKELGPNPLSVPWREGKKPSFRQERIATSVNNIENRFNAFANIASLMAARLVVRLPEREVWDHQAAHAELEVYLEVAKNMENVVFDAVPEYFPNPWSARATSPNFLGKIGYGWGLNDYPLFDL